MLFCLLAVGATLFSLKMLSTLNWRRGERMKTLKKVVEAFSWGSAISLFIGVSFYILALFPGPGGGAHKFYPGHQAKTYGLLVIAFTFVALIAAWLVWLCFHSTEHEVIKKRGELALLWVVLVGFFACAALQFYVVNHCDGLFISWLQQFYVSL